MSNWAFLSTGVSSNKVFANLNWFEQKQSFVSMKPTACTSVLKLSFYLWFIAVFIYGLLLCWVQSNKYAVKAKVVEVPVVKHIHKLFDVSYFFAHTVARTQLVIYLMNPLKYLVIFLLTSWLY